jgi:uncharacterized protein YegL
MPIQFESDPLPIGGNKERINTVQLNLTLRIPCILLIDSADPENEDNRLRNQKVLQTFHGILSENSYFREALDICIMSCGAAVELEHDFVSGADFQVPDIRTSTQRNLNTAINMALTKLEWKKKEYSQTGSRHTTPVLFLVSEGDATDRFFEEETRTRIRRCISEGEVAYVPMTLGDADTDYLESYYPTGLGAVPMLEPSASNFRDAMPSFWDNVMVSPHPFNDGIWL